ncbi:MAG: bifunctional hydroxymethylpyrimidine kinase/phosphomethylpyrimidine kinase [Promethearchaeota archaeon]
MKPKVLTIAGFDPSSGAGLTADIRTFENIGVFGMSVCTAITIQNAERVYEWIPVESENIRKQMEVIFNSYEIKFVKTGMLGTIKAINLIKEFQERYGFNLVVDPVIFSGTGKKLAEKNVEINIKKDLFPIALAITPNKFEAEMYSGKKITDYLSLKEVCSKLYQSGPKNVLVKGGHINDKDKKITDYLYNKDLFRDYSRKRVDLANNEHIHGTGCVFSSLITGFLALGYNIEESFFFSEDFMERTFKKKFPLKKGAVLDTGYNHEEISILMSVQKVVEFICSNTDFSGFIPEVRTNIAISKNNASSIEDIAAVEGRITIVGGKPIPAGPIKFGASDHTGRLILQAKQFDNSINAVINLKYSPETIQKLKNSDLSVFSVNRLKAGSNIRNKEETSMGWIVREIFNKINRIPDIIWDSGEPEKEPMIRIFAKNAEQLINKLTTFLKAVGN